MSLKQPKALVVPQMEGAVDHGTVIRWFKKFLLKQGQVGLKPWIPKPCSMP